MALSPFPGDEMKRREFITLLVGGGACASLSATRAQQQKKVARVGFLITGSLESPEGRSALDAFKQGLSQLGHIGRPHRLGFQFARRSSHFLTASLILGHIVTLPKPLSEIVVRSSHSWGLRTTPAAGVIVSIARQ